MKKLTLALFSLALALALVPASRADDIVFTYSAPGGVSGAGMLNGNFYPAGGVGAWLVTGGGGTFDDGTNSGPISLIANPNAPFSAMSPSGFVYDDLLYAAAGPGLNLDYDGLLFSFDGMELNLWEGGFPFEEGWDETSGAGGAGTFTVIAIAPIGTTPEPGSLPLLGTGLLALAFILRRKDRFSGQTA